MVNTNMHTAGPAVCIRLFTPFTAYPFTPFTAYPLLSFLLVLVLFVRPYQGPPFLRAELIAGTDGFGNDLHTCTQKCLRAAPRLDFGKEVLPA